MQIKTYEQFNEDLNLRKSILGAALGTSLAFNPMFAQNPKSIDKITKNTTTDVGGWGMVKWNMTPDEVSLKYNIDRQENLDKDRKILIIDKYTLKGTAWNIDVELLFFFRNNKLYQVCIQNKSSIIADYEDIKASLIEKYGAESYNDNDTQIDDTSHQRCDWFTTKTNIKLFLDRSHTGVVRYITAVYYKVPEESGF